MSPRSVVRMMVATLSGDSDADMGEPDEDRWEVHLANPANQPDPATWRTEVVQPYREPAGVSAPA